MNSNSIKKEQKTRKKLKKNETKKLRTTEIVLRTQPECGWIFFPQVQNVDLFLLASKRFQHCYHPVHQCVCRTAYIFNTIKIWAIEAYAKVFECQYKFDSCIDEKKEEISIIFLQKKTKNP